MGIEHDGGTRIVPVLRLYPDVVAKPLRLIAIIADSLFEYVGSSLLVATDTRGGYESLQKRYCIGSI